MTTYTWRCNLDKLMQKYPITQRELSEKTGVAGTTISRLVNNNHNRYDTKVLSALAAHFGITDTNELLELVITE
ncbi:MAG: helix-turn-helix transcriptional regulator [Moorea sp. SIO3G5]|nr:helix-turn-helix transcriptional regulator [Moorena sp. SIO3G5]